MIVSRNGHDPMLVLHAGPTICQTLHCVVSVAGDRYEDTLHHLWNYQRTLNLDFALSLFSSFFSRQEVVGVIF